MGSERRQAEPRTEYSLRDADARRPRPGPEKRTLPLNLIVLAGVLVALVLTVILLIWDGSDGDGTPDAAALERLADRIDEDDLEREGILVSLIEVKQRDGRGCVEVTMANPTAPNRAWLRDQYGPDVCPSRRSTTTYVKTDMLCPEPPGPDNDVPDITGMTPEAAHRRLKSAGFEPGCNTPVRPPAKGYPRTSPYRSLVVRRVCRLQAPRGARINLEYVGFLPGGYEYGVDRCS